MIDKLSKCHRRFVELEHMMSKCNESQPCFCLHSMNFDEL